MASEKNEKSNLAKLVNSFSAVFFNIGRFAFENKKNLEPVRVALDAYKTIKERYAEDTSVYDHEINSALDTFPDLNTLPRV